MQLVQLVGASETGGRQMCWPQCKAKESDVDVQCRQCVRGPRAYHAASLLGRAHVAHAVNALLVLHAALRKGHVAGDEVGIDVVDGLGAL